MSPENAETIAIRALGWLAGNEDLLGTFMGASGTSADDFLTRAKEPEFLVSVLDFLTMDDAWVIEFCDHAGLAYDRPMRARQALPGGQEVSWT